MATTKQRVKPGIKSVSFCPPDVFFKEEKLRAIEDINLLCYFVGTTRPHLYFAQQCPKVTGLF
tara:strand:- start:165 stop:353 length:189 start_codon:yes stop_codon:yes gene_type:complete